MRLLRMAIRLSN